MQSPAAIREAGRIRTRSRPYERDRARDRIQPFEHHPLVFGFSRGVEVLGHGPANPPLDRRQKILSRQPHEVGHRLLGGGRVTDAAQKGRDLTVARRFALQQNPIEIEKNGVKSQARAPNSAVPTLT